jgi:hypothetical protein
MEAKMLKSTEFIKYSNQQCKANNGNDAKNFQTQSQTSAQ